jgi:long-chain acyl-CoA synthetase
MESAVNRPCIVPLRGADRAEVIERALSVRQEGGIPLIGDERWPEAAWGRAVRSVEEARPPREAAWATFTSGTTGSPRILLRSEASWEVSRPAVERALGLRADDVMLLPVHPVSSMTVYSAAHARARGFGWRVPARARLSAVDLAGPTLMHGTPHHLAEAVDLLEAGAPTSLRAVLIGGDRLGARLAERARALGLDVVAYAGAAELSFVALDDGAGLRPFDGVEAEVRGDLLWVRTRQAACASIGEGGSLRRDGEWLTVGDRARLEPDGRLTLLGRADGAIRTAGATVIPADVEAVLNDLPGVEACLVVGEERPRWGAVVTALVQPRPGARLDPAELSRRARPLLTPGQLPRRWRLVAGLPRTGSGKVKRLSAAEWTRLEEAP